MTRREQLIALADKIERASAVDLRELECRVWFTLSQDGRAMGKSISFERMSAVVLDLNQWVAPCYLRSLDASMMLVPPNHRFRAITSSDCGRFFHADVESIKTCISSEGRGLNEVTARVAACLRAWAMMEEM